MTSKSPVLLMPMALIVEGRDILVVAVVARVLVKLEYRVLADSSRVQWGGLKTRTLRPPHARALVSIEDRGGMRAGRARTCTYSAS